MTIEIVEFPIKHGGSFHSFLLAFTRGYLDSRNQHVAVSRREGSIGAAWPARVLPQRHRAGWIGALDPHGFLQRSF